MSRQRNGSILHYFPSALPAGAKTRDGSGSAQSYCILDCIFHEVRKTGIKMINHVNIVILFGLDLVVV